MSDLTALESLASLNGAEILDGIQDIIKHPKKYMSPKHAVPIYMTLVPLAGVLANRFSKGGRTGAFIAGLSLMSPMFSELLRMYNIGVLRKDKSVDITYKTSEIDIVSLMLTGRHTAFLLFGILLSLVLSKLFVSKFSSKYIKASDLKNSYAIYYTTGAFVGLTIGFVIFLLYTSTNKRLSLMDAIKNYFGFIKDSIKNIVEFNRNSRISIFVSISVLISLINFLISVPFIIRLFKSTYKRNPMEYIGDNPNKAKEELMSKNVKLVTSVSKETVSLISKELKSAFNKTKISPTGLAKIIQVMITTKKYCKTKKDFMNVLKVLYGKSKPKEVISLTKTEIRKISGDLLKESDEPALDYVKSEFNLKYAFDFNRIGKSSSDKIESIRNMPPIEIKDYKSFELAYIKASVDVYFKLIESGYKVNDIKIVLAKDPAPPFSIDNLVVMGYNSKIWNGYTSDHIAGVMVHELGHIFNKDTFSHLVSMIPLLFGIVSSATYYYLNLSAIPKAEKVLLGLSASLYFIQVLEIGRTAEIRADAFAVKLGYAKEIYEFLSQFNETYIQKLFSELDEHDSLERRLKALLKFVKDNIDLNKDIPEVLTVG